MAYSITLNKPMAIFKRKQTEKKEDYVPMGSWDVTNKSEEEILAMVKETLANFREEDCRPAEEVFREWDEERAKCYATK